MHNISTISYILDSLGIFAVLAGGYLATRTTYSKENSKDAAILIDTQGKRITFLEGEITRIDTDRSKCRDDISKLSGELKAYKQMALVSPEIISKLSSTLDAILGSLTKDGIHIDTQKVETQIVTKAK